MWFPCAHAHTYLLLILHQLLHWFCLRLESRPDSVNSDFNQAHFMHPKVNTMVKPNENPVSKASPLQFQAPLPSALKETRQLTEQRYVAFINCYPTVADTVQF